MTRRKFVLVALIAVFSLAVVGCSRGTPLFYDDFATDPAAAEFERVRIDGTVEQVVEHEDGGAELLVFAAGDASRPIRVIAPPEIWGAAVKADTITVDGMLVGETMAFGYDEPIPSMEASSFGVSFLE